MAINSNVVSHFFHFCPDDKNSVETSAKLFSELKLVTDNLLSIELPSCLLSFLSLVLALLSLPDILVVCKPHMTSDINGKLLNF